MTITRSLPVETLKNSCNDHRIINTLKLKRSSSDRQAYDATLLVTRLPPGQGGLSVYNWTKQDYTDYERGTNTFRKFLYSILYILRAAAQD